MIGIQDALLADDLVLGAGSDVEVGILDLIEALAMSPRVAFIQTLATRSKVSTLPSSNCSTIALASSRMLLKPR